MWAGVLMLGKAGALMWGEAMALTSILVQLMQKRARHRRLVSTYLQEIGNEFFSYNPVIYRKNSILVPVSL
jgi:hypothetical protein